MSAADHPIRGALSLAAGAGFIVLAPIGVTLIVAGGWATTVVGSALCWGVVWRMSQPARRWERR